MHDTTRLENAYKRFGNTMYVDHWHKAPSLIGTIRPIVPNRIIDINSKPKFWKRAIQLSHKKFERLSMNKKLDTALVSRNGRYLKFYPTTAKELEKFARRKNFHDWQIEIIEAFESLIYQRQGTNKWLLIECGKGYA